MTLGEFMRNTDFRLLTIQKQTLLDLLDRDLLTSDQDQSIQGLINFLDGFQDAVVDGGVLQNQDQKLFLKYYQKNLQDKIN
jgi:hypothetical protein